MQRERAKEKDKPSIFGSAKPVDTASREREIEERLQREQQQLQKELLEKEKRDGEGVSDNSFNWWQ